MRVGYIGGRGALEGKHIKNTKEKTDK